MTIVAIVARTIAGFRIKTTIRRYYKPEPFGHGTGYSPYRSVKLIGLFSTYAYRFSDCGVVWSTTPHPAGSGRQPAPRRRIVLAEEEVIRPRAARAGGHVLILAGEGAVGRAGFFIGLAEGRVGLLGVNRVCPGGCQARTPQPIGVANEVQSASIVDRRCYSGFVPTLLPEPLFLLGFRSLLVAVLAFPAAAHAASRVQAAPVPPEMRSTAFTVTVNGQPVDVAHAAASYEYVSFDVTGPLTSRSPPPSRASGTRAWTFSPGGWACGPCGKARPSASGSRGRPSSPSRGPATF